jgi:hypothetical protein
VPNLACMSAIPNAPIAAPSSAFSGLHGVAKLRPPVEQAAGSAGVTLVSITDNDAALKVVDV